MSIQFIRKDFSENTPIYKELLWILSDGNQWIDTGIKVDQNTRVLLDFKQNNSDQWSCFLGDNKGIQLQKGGPANRLEIMSMLYNLENISYTYDLSKRIIYELNRTQLFLDETLINTFTFREGESTNNLVLFAVPGDQGGVVALSKMYLYNFKIYKNDIKIMDLIPVKDLNGVVCLYDKVSKTFFYNQGTGNFTAGREI